jgi:hypothetical protein
LKAARSLEIEGIDGVILALDRVSPEQVGQIPLGVHILAKKLSVHAMSLTQGAGISVVSEIPDEDMHFDAVKKQWVLGGVSLEDGQVLSIDGHRNQLAYHQSGNIYMGAIPLKNVKIESNISSSPLVISPAMIGSKPSKSGGIDFNANQMNMNVVKERNGVGVNFDTAMVEQIRRNGFEGFVPVIINVQPIKDIRLLLGVK